MNKRTMKILSIFMFVILFFNNNIIVHAQKNSIPKNNKDSVTIYENEKEYVISSTENKNVYILKYNW